MSISRFRKEMTTLRKMKTLLLILLAAALLAACAALPAVAAAVQDRSAVNHSGFSGLKSVKLELHEKDETLPMLGKLACLRNMASVNIAPIQASMTEEEAIAAAEAAMVLYEEAGIFQWLDLTCLSAVPKLSMDPEDASEFIMYWTVTFVGETDGGPSLLLDVDDDTGKILCISYAVYGSYTMDDVWERNAGILDAFTDIYFSQLGLTEAAQQVISTGTGYKYFERDGECSSAQYSFSDTVYGEINLEFSVDGAGGFSLCFHN